MKRTSRILKASLALGCGAVMAASSVLCAFAAAGEDPGTVDDADKVFPDPDSFSYDDVEVDFSKALSLSMYFYDANKCGSGITGGRLEWRGDCHIEDAKIPLKTYGEDYIGVNLSQDFIDAHLDILDPDGDGCIDCDGGMHDAGDHVKFCLPGSYAASTLGWGYYEFRDAYEKSGNAKHIEEILHWFCDYYLKCIYYNEDGSVLAYCYQVGEGNIDHNYWIAPDLQNTNLKDFARPAYLATVDTPASDMCAGTAAALAISYLNFKDTEPEFAAECLKGAYALYDFAVETHAEDEGLKVLSLGYDGGFYTSSYDYDELAWAAVWLYECTLSEDPTAQDKAWGYIDDIVHVDETVTGEMGAHPYTGYLKRIIADTGNCWQNIWVHCWDTVWGGVFAKLAPITNCSRDWYIFRWNLEFWSGMSPADAAAAKGLPAAVTAHKDFGLDDEVWNTTITAEEIAELPEEDGAWLQKTPAGFGMLNDYGSARYDAAAQLCALVYAKETGDMTFADWAKGQMEYLMGKNPMNRAYIVGYSDTAASHPHHRAAHGSMTQNMDDPEKQTHVLWGALVGGPDAGDWHRDITKDYIYNEVAVDYNAAFVGACAGLYNYYGTDDMMTTEFIPPKESELKTPEEYREFTLKAAIGQEDAQSTQVLIEICNRTQRPPRYPKDIKVRYYFSIAELLSNGQTVDDLQVRVDYDEIKSNSDGEYEVTYEVVQYSEDGGCYIELSFPDYEFYGSVQFQFALMDPVQNDQFTFIWDPSDDYSRQGLQTADELGVPLNEAPDFHDGITMYAEGNHVWGTGPDDEPDVPDTPDTPDTPEDQTIYGDVNCDSEVSAADAVLLSKVLASDAKDTATEQGLQNADCKGDSVIDSEDLLKLMGYLSGQVPMPDLGQP